MDKDWNSGWIIHNNEILLNILYFFKTNTKIYN